MAAESKKKKGYGLIRNFGWKKNLLAIAAGFIVLRLVDFIIGLTSTVNVISSFDFSIAIMPLIVFVLGGWGVLGCILENIYLFVEFASMGIALDVRMALNVVARIVGFVVYCALPSILWYATPLKGEERVRYPRMDTTAHVVKYYLIMIASVAIYVLSLWFITLVFDQAESLLAYAATFTQYLDVVLILGLPLLIVISVVHNRTITINERMVLAFLLIGVFASALGGALIYLTVRKLDPGLFTDFGELLNGAEYYEWTEVQEGIVNRYLRFWDWYYVIIAIMLNGMLIVEILFMRRIEKKVTHPILHLADVLEEYTQHEEKVLAAETVATRCEPFKQGYGEVSSLTGACVEMVEEINRYTDNLKQATVEQQRIKTELDVASQIQRDMLPSIFPPFPDRSEIDLYASMTPAKEVGGDFYDFYMLDQEHLVLTIADVSGKGVPASLFMVISMTLLNNYAQSSVSPKEILGYVNHQLCQNNDAMMFCTVWLGILNLKTGRLIASNAGHEYPAIRRSGGEFELFRDKHSAPLGFRDGLQYQEYEIQLFPGDCLFEYTDGVTEATDASEELFGEERMLEALNSAPDASVEQKISRVYDAIHGFVKDAPQFDDITMLCLQYKGSDDGQADDKVMLTVPAKLEAIGEVTEFVAKQLTAVDCPEDIQFSFALVVEEICANIANYAYTDKAGDMTVAFSFKEDERLAEIVFTDDGIPFDPTARPEPDITLPAADRKIGGLGIHIVKKVMDEVTYQYIRGQNVLTVRKHLTAET